MGGQRRARAVERKHFDSAVDMARALPHLFRPISDSPVLIPEEDEAFAQCEAAVENLKLAFWAAGKALHIIRDGRLYRATHSSFPDYCQERWDLTEGQANKLIRTWPIAEVLTADPNGAAIPEQRANQAQMWELVPVADRWDTNAAAFVYRTVLEVDGVPLTAAVLKGAVSALPAGETFDQRAAAAAIRERLALLQEQEQGDDQGDDYEARAQRAVPLRWLRRVAQKDRAGAAAYLDQVQQQIDKARAELLASAE